jgi:hypothetical protein
LTSTADRVPNYTVPPLNKDGTWNPIWWRFFARIAAQFSGQDAPVMPIDPGNLSLTGPPAQPSPPFSAATFEAAQQYAGSLPQTVPAHDSQARDLAAIALSRSPPATARLGLQLIQDTLANQPAAASYGDGTVVFYATDTQEFYVVDGGAWVQAMGFLSFDPGANKVTIAGGAHLDGTHAQDIGTGDSPTFAGVTVTGAATGSLALTVTTQTVQYVDWMGTHQMVDVVTAVAITANAFTAGIRTT